MLEGLSLKKDGATTDSGSQGKKNMITTFQIHPHMNLLDMKKIETIWKHPKTSSAGQLLLPSLCKPSSSKRASSDSSGDGRLSPHGLGSPTLGKEGSQQSLVPWVPKISEVQWETENKTSAKCHVWGCFMSHILTKKNHYHWSLVNL